jgi:outer membrane scaffolding protein for murein synthesis (MipA/OmpV family)
MKTRIILFIALTLQYFPPIAEPGTSAQPGDSAIPVAAVEEPVAETSEPIDISLGTGQKRWGIAMGFRIARIPYPSAEKQVSDVVPLMFYDGDLFYIRGLESGIRLWYNETWGLDLIGRYRFFDIPADYQNLVRGSALDAGARFTYHVNKDLDTYVELMSDDYGRAYSSIGTRYHFESGSWELFPYATVRFKSAEFNDHYFGLDGFVNPDDINTRIDNKIGTGFDLTLGSEIRYHVISNLYILGRAQITTLDSDTADNPAIQRQTYGEIYLGFAFFNDKTKPLARSLKAKPYVRLSHAWATPSNIGDILAFNTEDDEQNNQLTSLFYGHPIADDLFGHEPLDIYLTVGYARHHKADPYDQTIRPDSGINTTEFAQLPQVPCNGIDPCTITYQTQPSNEYILGIKAYYNFNWPIHWRLGFAEGLSYIDNVSNLEQREMDRKGYRASNLMNYLDFTADLSLGSLMGIPTMRDTYFGVGIHHRSSIFETASAFGRIKGGSNYNAIYLQQHF